MLVSNSPSQTVGWEQSGAEIGEQTAEAALHQGETLYCRSKDNSIFENSLSRSGANLNASKGLFKGEGRGALRTSIMRCEINDSCPLTEFFCDCIVFKYHQNHNMDDCY